MSESDFLRADVAGPKEVSGLDAFLVSGWEAFGGFCVEGRIEGPTDLALLFALDWLGGKLPAARRAKVQAFLRQIGIEPLSVDRKTGLVLADLSAALFCPAAVEAIAKALRKEGVEPSFRARVESRLLERFEGIPTGASRGGQEPPPLPPSYSDSDRIRLDAARAAFAVMPGGVPTCARDLGVVFYLAGLHQESRSNDEREEGAAVRLVHLGFGDLAVRGERLDALGRWLDGEENADMAARVDGLWARVLSDREELRRSGESVRARLAPTWRGGLSLDPHQVEGVARIEKAGWRMMISDDMGLGKGPMSLGAVALCPDAWPMVIVAPVSMLGAWKDEVARWLTPVPEVIDLTHPRVLSGLKLKPGDRTILLCNWSFLSLHGKAIQSPFFRVIRGVIGDESQAITNAESGRTRSFFRLRSPARLRLLLTGTPQPNGRGIELWSQLSAVEPNKLPSFREWKNRYCGARFQHIGGLGKDGKPKVVRIFDGRSNLVELASIRAERELRRTKAELGSDRLPTKTRYIFPITLSLSDHVKIESEKEAARLALVDRATKVAAEMAADGATESQVQAKVASILRANAVASLGRVRAVVGRLKIPHVVPLLKDLLDEGHRVIVSGFHLAVLREAAEWFGREICDPKDVLSGVDLATPEARSRLVRDWESGKGKLLMLSGKYNSGVTLVSGSRMVPLERFWIPSTELQFEDRIHRRGQTNDCAYHYAMAMGTTDDAAGKVLTWKETGISASQGTLSSRALTMLFAGRLYEGVVGQALVGMGALSGEGALDGEEESEEEGAG